MTSRANRHSRSRKRILTKRKQSRRRTKSVGRSRRRPQPRHRRFRACADGTCSLCQEDLRPNDAGGVLFHWACGNHLTHVQCTHDMARSNHFMSMLDCPICRRPTDWSGQLHIITQFDQLLRSITNQADQHTIVLGDVSCISTPVELDMIVGAFMQKDNVRTVDSETFGLTHILPWKPQRRSCPALTVELGSCPSPSSASATFDSLMQKLRLRHLMLIQATSEWKMKVTVNDLNANIEYALLKQVLERHRMSVIDMGLYNIKDGVQIPTFVRTLHIYGGELQHIKIDKRARSRMGSLHIQDVICTREFVTRLVAFKHIDKLALTSVKGDCATTQALIDLVRQVNITTLDIVNCDFNHGSNGSCELHPLLDACDQRNVSVVNVRETHLGDKYDVSKKWPEGWNVMRFPPESARVRPLEGDVLDDGEQQAKRRRVSSSL